MSNFESMAVCRHVVVGLHGSELERRGVYLIKDYRKGTMLNQSVHVLLVEDNPDDACRIRQLINEGFSMPLTWKNVETLSTAKELLCTETFDIVLLELLLPDSQGLDTFLRLHPYAISLPVILLTRVDDEGLAIQAVRSGAQDYLIKDQMNGKGLARAMRYAIERKRIEITLRAQNQQLSELAEQRSPKLSLVSARDELVFRLVGELNNPLATLSVQLEELMAQFPKDHASHGTLQGVQSEIERLGRLVGSLLQDSLTNVEQAATSELLSSRERETVYLVAKGYTNKEIARQLSVSVRTVERLCSLIINKLGLQNRAGLVAYAVQRGILNQGDIKS
jgi:DNA-binding NarL/FixJ family response regulator